ncbi:molybdate ABC transporter substrate-binding protein [Roseateles saccharophilus]|uniref:Molybdate transport system substrate-binding protein n=1 Tax=Roseateles saccharophilus TaxID=304 RepID=A0A4R3VAQ7_ROSSA|nr:molybdate ABC transporter substrate-binding protein [Roseateles saccharophilus]MDG0833861.1 molybdate ABC transporter substrate-binding protein [Roseateles saccharophilus]TCV02317.1 molybdate transport system substrate-binding protein [Roseateles saccharophilus]
MKKRLLLALSLAALPLLACAQQLTVSAAASLTDAFKEIGPRFEAGRPGASLRFNFAASGVLLQQIVQGAPVDVFASADQETMNRGAAQKLVAADTRRDFASNTLVLIAPAHGGPGVAALADLGRAEVRRIAVGKPASVPVGRYTQQALEGAQLWAGLAPKLVFAENVRQVLDYVSRGEVEAGFVYRTDAELLKDRVRIALTVGGHTPVTYPVAVIADSKQAALARDFVAFLGSAEAQAILAKYGFGRP